MNHRKWAMHFMFRTNLQMELSSKIEDRKRIQNSPEIMEISGLCFFWFEINILISRRQI